MCGCGLLTAWYFSADRSKWRPRYFVGKHKLGVKAKHRHYRKGIKTAEDAKIMRAARKPTQQQAAREAMRRRLVQLKIIPHNAKPADVHRAINAFFRRCHRCHQRHLPRTRCVRNERNQLLRLIHLARKAYLDHLATAGTPSRALLSS